MTDPLLRRVTLAAAKRKAVEDEYREALRAAQEGGKSYAEIARAAGVTRQAIRKQLSA